MLVCAIPANVGTNYGAHMSSDQKNAQISFHLLNSSKNQQLLPANLAMSLLRVRTGKIHSLLFNGGNLEARRTTYVHLLQTAGVAAPLTVKVTGQLEMCASLHVTDVDCERPDVAKKLASTTVRLCKLTQ